MSKIERSVRGPSWAEVILGAFLSLLLGVVLAMAVLIMRPVVGAKELPKPEERKPGTVYYIEGSRDSAKARQALAKRKAFAEGQTVTVTEEEVNTMLSAEATPAGATAAAKPPAKQDDKKAQGAESGESLAVGVPNVRIRDSQVQVAAPVTVNTLGLNQKVIAQARGGFVKKGDVFMYEPAEMYLNSLPVQRVPGLNTYVRNKILSAKPIPEDIAVAWRKLNEVVVEGNTVRLSP